MMMMRIPMIRSAVCGVMLALLLGGAALQAAPPAKPIDAANPWAAPERDEADKLFVRGYSAYVAGKLEEAEGLFKQAFLLKQTHDIAANLGLMELKLGKSAEAAKNLSFALRNSPPSISNTIRAKLKEQLDQALQFVGTLRVKAGLPGAEIVVDGKVVGTSPLDGEVFVEPGAHTVEARLAGYTGAPVAVTVGKGEARDVELPLVKSEAVGGFAGAGEKPKTPGGEQAIEEGGPKKGILIAGIASSAVLVGAGAVFAIIANMKSSTADELQSTLSQKSGGRACQQPTAHAAECSQLDSSLGARDTFGQTAIWSCIAGGTLGAATAIYALAMPKAKTKVTPQALPVVVASGGGLVIAGQW